MPQGKSWLSAGIRRGLCPSCTPPPNSRCYTHSWLSTQEDVQIPHRAARRSRLNWYLLSSPWPLCIVIRSSSMLCLRAALRWHLVTIQHLPAWSVSTHPTASPWLVRARWLPASRRGCLLLLRAWSPAHPELQVAAEAKAFEGRNRNYVFRLSNEHYRRIRLYYRIVDIWFLGLLFFPWTTCSGYYKEQDSTLNWPDQVRTLLNISMPINAGSGR